MGFQSVSRPNSSLKKKQGKQKWQSTWSSMSAFLGVGVRRAFIHCTDKAPTSPMALAWPAIDHAAEVARQQGWWYRTLPTDHSPHQTMPHELADLLLDLALGRACIGPFCHVEAEDAGILTYV